MNKEIINSMINNSTWKKSDNSVILKFSNGKDLSLNGKNHELYSINTLDDKIVIQFSSGKNYYVEYVNDFNLNLYNAEEHFRIMPE